MLGFNKIATKNVIKIKTLNGQIELKQVRFLIGKNLISWNGQ